MAIYSPGGGKYVKAEQLSEKPDSYVELTILELENCPYLEKAVLSPGTEVRVPFNDNTMTEYQQIIRNNQTQNLKVGMNYYKINIFFAD